MPRAAKFTLPDLPFELEPLGKRIAKLRKDRGLTQESLAEKIGISRKLVTDYETGRIHMNEQLLVRFAVALDVSTDELLGLSQLQIANGEPSLRFTRRIRELEALPEIKKKAILKTLDDLIRANS